MTVGESLMMAWVNALGPMLNVCFWPIATFSRRRSNSVAFGVKRTLGQIYEYRSF